MSTMHLTPLEVISRYPVHDYTLCGAFAGRASAEAARPFLMLPERIWCWSDFGER